MRYGTIGLASVLFLLMAPTAQAFAGDASTAKGEEAIIGRDIPQIEFYFERNAAVPDPDDAPATIRGHGFTYDRHDAITHDMERGQGIPAKPRPELLSTENT